MFVKMTMVFGKVLIMKSNARKVGEKKQLRMYVEYMLKLKYQMEVLVERRIGT